jgi:hypothetical protein
MIHQTGVSAPSAAMMAPAAALSLSAFEALPGAIVASPAASIDAAVVPNAMPALTQIAAPTADAAAVPTLAANSFDGSAQPAAAAPLPYDAPSQSASWYDRHTGGLESQASKIKKALQLAMSHPKAAAIKNGMSQNTLYRVDNTGRGLTPQSSVRTQGDDPERPGETPLVVFHADALTQLSPEFLAAKLASMWTRHFYKDSIPVSAEKTYIEGSVMIEVFRALTQSTAQWWNGAKDFFSFGNFEIYRHFFHWVQGFESRFSNVRQGPYFHDKIMNAEGDPDIATDDRGRRTIYQRVRDGDVSADAGTAAQQKFDGFVSNERP